MSRFKTKNDMIGYLLEQFENYDNIIIVADREIAQMFAQEYGEDESFEHNSIYISTGVNDYYIEKVEGECFCIESAKRLGEYIILESENIIVLEDLITEELLEALEVEYLEIVGIGEDDEFNCECDCDCCTCECEDDEEYNKLDEAEEEFISEIAEEYDVNPEILAYVFAKGYNDGRNTTLLSVSQLLNDIAQD